jgi:hypothetical protein
LIAITHGSNVLGVVNPVHEYGKLARSTGSSCFSTRPRPSGGGDRRADARRGPDRLSRAQEPVRPDGHGRALRPAGHPDPVLPGRRQRVQGGAGGPSRGDAVPAGGGNAQRPRLCGAPGRHRVRGARGDREDPGPRAAARAAVRRRTSRQSEGDALQLPEPRPAARAGVALDPRRRSGPGRSRHGREVRHRRRPAFTAPREPTSSWARCRRERCGSASATSTPRPTRTPPRGP